MRAVDQVGVLAVGQDHVVARVGEARRDAVDDLLQRGPDRLGVHAGVRPRVDAQRAGVGDHRRPAGRQPAVDAPDRGVQLGPDELDDLRRHVGHQPQRLEFLDQRGDARDRVDRVVAPAGMRRVPVGRDVPVQPAAVPEVDVQVGQLGQDAQVAVVLLEEADRADLVAHVIDDAGHQHLPRPALLAARQRRARGDDAGDARLHVHHRVAVQPAVGERPGVGVRVPADADRLGVDVAGQHERRPRPTGVDDADDVLAARQRLLLVDLVVPHAAHPRGEHVGELRLVADHARDPHDLLGQQDRVLVVDDVEVVGGG